ncbi:hypothetical protein EDD18DRAFT_1147334 [Armillaria luteobubalina]|uniref:F-box domain-containing protein n=1 Tax=Armillaria luteobubalina TaxID=153913 RepID=A0AA39TUQ9_9AGAR|nr:hypothetical protein EDD18DRAFT_1147334 [Armillaria luteobubalina]
MQASGLPPELCDAIIDELREDKKSLLQISLTCRALCPRTRVHLFHAVTLLGKSCCDRLCALITLSPTLALHFKSLRINWRIRNWNRNHLENYEPLTVIESLVGVTDLYLALDDWGRLPDAVASSLQSCSYRNLSIGGYCTFASMGEFCLLLQNSPGLEQVSFSCKNIPPMLCDQDRSLHGTPAPSTLRIIDYQDTTSVPSERPRSLLTLAISSHPCPFSFCNIRTLTVCLSGPSTMFLEDLRKYLALPSTSLKHFCVIHGFRPVWSHRGSPLASLDVSDIESIEIRVYRDRPLFLNPGTLDILRWWISNFSSTDKRNIIRSLTFTNFTSISFPRKEERSTLDQEDLWMRLNDCLTSYKMGSLERLAITFDQRPAKWNMLKAQVEANFQGLKKSGCEVILDVVTREKN